MTQYILEEAKPLSQSMIWQLQKNFYSQLGVKAWNQGMVPYYITSNPTIAGAYAQVVFGFMRDYFSQAVPTDQPIYIIELGAGSGRFSYHFLKLFQRLYQGSSLEGKPFKYIMTDIADQTLAFWRNHVLLAPFVEAGTLDFALFEAGQDQTLTLTETQQVFTPDTVQSPVVIIANYVFDTIPQDCFYFKGHRIFESLVTTTSSQPDSDLNDPNLIQRVSIQYEHKPTIASYYDDRAYNHLLRDYQNQLDQTTLLFPKAALDCIRHFRQLSHDHLLVLSGDKGYIREEALMGWEDQELTVHGSFSMMVNYHAIAQYVQNMEGQVLQMSHKHDSLNVSAFLLGDHAHRFVETQKAYQMAVDAYGPDDFYVLKEGIEGTYKTLKPNHLLSFLRLSHWDAYLFLELAPALLSMLADVEEPVKEALFQMAHHIWDMYYPIGEIDDLAFQLGILLYTIDYYTAAITFYNRSIDMQGPDASTYYNLSLCHFALRQYAEAHTYIEEALETDPAFEGGQDLWQDIQQKLGEEAEVRDKTPLG